MWSIHLEENLNLLIRSFFFDVQISAILIKSYLKG